MNRVARKGLLTAMVAGGVLASVASAGRAQADPTAEGGSSGSPGVLSGNSVSVPVDVPVNVCGNSVDVAGLLDPAMGNRCADTSVHRQPAAPSPPRHRPVPAPPHEPPAPALAHTGGEGAGLTAAGGAALLLGGAVLYRKARSTTGR